MKESNIPLSASKQQVRKWFYKVPTRLMNEIIKASIIEHNKTAKIQTSLRCHNLNYYHLKFIFEELGDPFLSE